jgi:diguanylate cyclase (GGDEF)-like protein
MKLSVKKIFSNINLLFIVLTLLLGLATATVVMEYASFKKIENLQNQKMLVNYIASLGRDDLELSNVQFRGKSTQLIHENRKLAEIYNFDVITQTFFSEPASYDSQLDELKVLTLLFSDAAEQWYDQKSELSEKELAKRKDALANAQSRLIDQIDFMIIKNVDYEYNRFKVQELFVYFSLATVLFGLLWYSRRLNVIYKDFLFLNAVDTHESNYVIRTEEANAILKRMGRKPSTSENPSMTDPVTQINNYKGMLQEFSEKKPSKKGDYTGLCVFEIDDFSTIQRQYPKEFSQTVLKKIAFMISLYQRHTDVIARSDMNQFTVILTRADKKQALNDCELIRKSVEETLFKVPKGEAIRITISGGFIQKSGQKSLEESINMAKEVLQTAIAHGKNRIAQLRDTAAPLK